MVRWAAHYRGRVTRDAERTKRLLQQAATAEFSEYGLHGTTVERIAARAGVNKERLYSYYGGKSQLFGMVLLEQLAHIVDTVPFSADSPAEVARYAGRTFDHQLDHPELNRLLAWEALADVGSAQGEASRTQAYRAKIDALAAGQRRGILADEVPPAELLLLVLSMANWGTSVPQVARMVTGDTVLDRAVRARRRAAVEQAVRHLVTPRS